MPLTPTGDTRVWLDGGDGWQELTGVTRIAIEEQHQPIEDWPDPIEGYGMGKTMGLLATLEDRWFVTPIELALMILRPHLARCPPYRDA